MTRAPDFEISSRFVSKDPEYEITYVERDDEGERSYRCPQIVDDVLVDELDAWTSPPSPMTPEARERVLDRLAAWCFAGGGLGPKAKTIFGPENTPLRIPGPYQIDLGRSAWTWDVTYREQGRYVVLRAMSLTPNASGDPRPRALLARGALPRVWSTGAPISEDERRTLCDRLVAEEEAAIEIEPEDAPRDAWVLAEELAGLRETFLVGLAEGETGRLAAMLAARTRGERGGDAVEADADVTQRSWLARVELPALATGRTGWMFDGPRAWLAPIALEKLGAVRDALFADALPFEPDAAPTGETRATLWAWASMRARGAVIPDELARRGAGVVLERRTAAGLSVLAMYEDGRVRYVGPWAVIACEPGAAPSVPGIGLALHDVPLGARDASELEVGEARLTVLTCGGAFVVRGAAAQVAVEQGERALRGVLAWAFRDALPPPRPLEPL